jgi:processive 1,2-diacylglycerol beta-glucosyltransferase
MSARDVLIVSASTGTGHARAGDAVTEAVSTLSPDSRVEHVDLLDLGPRWVRAAYGDGYELIATKAPRIWRQVYRRTDSAAADAARWGPVAHRLLFGGFRRLLLSRPWSVCVCTHFLPGQLAAGRPGLPPFAMVITDLTLHSFWAQPRVRRYFVAGRGLAFQLRRRVRFADVQPTGIPIAARFASPPGKREVRAALGLRQRDPVVLVMGGGLGIGVADSALAALSSPVPGLQVVAVCGRNDADANRLRGVGIGPEWLRVLDYVPDVERYIAAADAVVTKPGGLTTSEVLALGKPLVLTRAIPGQEEGNTRVLCAAGTALSAPDGASVRQALGRLFAEPGKIEALSAAARAHGRPHAAHTIASAIQREYPQRLAPPAVGRGAERTVNVLRRPFTTPDPAFTPTR